MLINRNNQQKQTTNESNTYCSHLNASRAARNYFVDRMFVTPDLVSHAHPSQEGSWVNPVFPNRFRLVAPHRIQITCGTQWRTHSNFLKNPSPACATFLVKLCNPITRQAIERESSSNPLRQWFPTFFITFLPLLILELLIPPLLHKLFFHSSPITRVYENLINGYILSRLPFTCYGELIFELGRLYGLQMKNGLY